MRGLVAAAAQRKNIAQQQRQQQQTSLKTIVVMNDGSKPNSAAARRDVGCPNEPDGSKNGNKLLWQCREFLGNGKNLACDYRFH